MAEILGKKACKEKNHSIWLPETFKIAHDTSMSYYFLRPTKKIMTF